ncbi:MAG: glutamine-hydrolyzing carbamoyl-phosphate synthase small subunit [Acidobacteria bacterium]|nr:glutamine-hydrolyzing carbamoyl-phosphate synthase small subunit [Acidobacteriota bacterium]
MSFEQILALEDGRVFRGVGIGARAERGGEVVFNTGMTGYQEIFTDPSYSGQIVVLTYPQIGNYGANEQDGESSRPYIEGLVVREFSKISSNWRSKERADDYLAYHDIPILGEIDTRALVRHLRDHGAQRGVISSLDLDVDSLVAKARALPTMAGLDLASKVSVAKPYEWRQGVTPCSPSQLVDEPGEPRFHVVAYDFGIKRNILRRLVQIGARVTVVPAHTKAEDVMAMRPDGVFISNGPGDPEPLDAQAFQIRQMVGRVPIFGICLGHQVLGLALGGKTFKLKFGHHGCNHPVRNELTGQVEITSQNHGFCVDPDSLPAGSTEVTHINLNDQTVEGFRSTKDPLFCVQYHPEAAPGPHDSRYLFDDFRTLMEAGK